MGKISPTGDLGFKKVFGSEENEDILRGIIKDFIDIEADEITIKNPYSIKSYKKSLENKKEENEFGQTLTDVSASLKFAEFTSEIQVREVGFFDERVLYYPFDRFCSNYKREDRIIIPLSGRPNKYSSLVPVFSLNILAYNHFSEDDDALRIFELYDPKRHKRYRKDLIKIGFFELLKSNIETSNQKEWRNYFTMREVSATAPDYIKKAVEVIDTANLSEEEIELAKRIEKAQATYEAELFFVEWKKAVEIAKNMLRHQMSIEDISDITGLSKSEIKALQQ